MGGGGGGGRRGGRVEDERQPKLQARVKQFYSQAGRRGEIASEIRPHISFKWVSLILAGAYLP